MALTPEELLRPRYEVINNYPNNKDHPLGLIIVLENDGTFNQHTIKDCQGKRMYTDVFYDIYPYLFRKLKWWEKREENEMPQYVKRNDGSEVFERVFKYDGSGSIMVRYPKGIYGKGTTGPIGLLNVQPATQQEYDEYIQSKQIKP